MFLQVSICPRGGHAYWWGGMHGCEGAYVVAGGMHGCKGACMVVGGCVVVGGMCGGRGHVWWQGACMIVGGMHCCGGACVVVGVACMVVGGMRGIRRDTVNERAVRILLECILVIYIFYISTSIFRLGTGNTVGENQYCEQTSRDTNTPTDFYLRLGSYGPENTINWIMHLPTTTPPTTPTTTQTTTAAPTTVTVPPRADVTTATDTTDVATSSSNVVSFGLWQMTVVVLRLVLP